MAKKRRWIFFWVVIRAVALTFGLCWFVHSQLSAPKSQSSIERETLVERLARKANLCESQVKVLLRELGPALARELNSSKAIHFRGLGRFQIESLPAFQQFDAKTKEYRFVPSSQSVTFTPSEELIHRVNYSSDAHWALNEPPPAQVLQFARNE